MKFRVAREDLADAVAWVAKSLPARPPVPVLGGILLTVDESTLTVAGFDYEVSTRAEVSVDADSNGKVLVSGRLLSEIARALPASKPVDISVEGSRVTIVGGSARFTLPTMPVDDYPSLPEMPTASGTIDGADFAEAVNQTQISAGRDETLPMLTGIRIEIDGEKLTLAATDRFRLAVRELTWTPSTPNISTAVLVPARTLADAAKTLGGSHSTPVTLALGEVCWVWKPAAAAPPSGCSTSSSSSTARCCPPRTQPPSKCRSACSPKRSSGSRWSPIVVTTYGCRSPTAR